MGKSSFSRVELLEMCNAALSRDPSQLYKESFIMSVDTVKGESESERTEIIAECINDRINDLKGIRVVPRENYKVITHKGELTDSNQDEKNLAKVLFNQSKLGEKGQRIEYDFIGIIVDYETPLKSSNQDAGVGKMDLLSVDDDNSCVYILELKKKDSSESMLRCVLEAYTYSKQVNEEKLKESFGIPQDYCIKFAPLVSKGGKQWEEMQELIDGRKPQLKKLMKELGVDGPFYYYQETGGEYKITSD